jgi:transposase-like protein
MNNGMLEVFRPLRRFPQNVDTLHVWLYAAVPTEGLKLRTLRNAHSMR